MLELRAVSPTLDNVHQRFVDDGLPATLRRDAFAAFNRLNYPPAALARGRAAWQARTLDEQASLIVASRFLADLTEMGTSRDILGCAARLLRDKDRHVEVCRRLVVALGGKSQIPGTPRPPKRSSASVQGRVLRVVIGQLCVEDAIAMRILASMSKMTEDPTARAAVEMFASDAAAASQLGWSMLDVVLPALGDTELKDLSRILPRAFGIAERIYNPAPISPGTRSGTPTHPFGSVDAATKAQLFTDACDRIIDRFERLGIPGRDAFRRRPRGTQG